MAHAVIAAASLAELFRERARSQPHAPAVSDGKDTLSYSQLAARVSQLAAGLRAAGLQPGERIAVLSENRLEYVELQLTAATLGAIVACLNWRLAADEQQHCIRLVEPRMIFVSPRHAPALADIAHGVPQVLGFGDDFERLRRAGTAPEAWPDIDPETGLVILYTSGTTGLPKGALISQRAMLARAMVYASDYGIGRTHSYIAWSPLFHMAATDHALATLLLGGHLHIADGLDLERIGAVLMREPVGWLLAMPGVIDPLLDALRPLAGPADCAAHGGRDGRPGAAAADRRADAPGGRAVPQQLRLHRDRAAAGIGRAAGAGRRAAEPEQAHLGRVPRAPGRCRRARGGHRRAGRDDAARADAVQRLLERRRGQRTRPARRLVPHGRRVRAPCRRQRWTSSTG